MLLWPFKSNSQVVWLYRDICREYKNFNAAQNHHISILHTWMLIPACMHNLHNLHSLACLSKELFRISRLVLILSFFKLLGWLWCIATHLPSIWKLKNHRNITYMTKASFIGTILVLNAEKLKCCYCRSLNNFYTSLMMRVHLIF